MTKYKVVASIATFPQRLESLKKTKESIISQVDQLNIYLNGYEEVPEFLNDSKINAVLSKDAIGDLKDNGKFFFLDKVADNSYYFTIDDDIEYPDDYTSRMIEILGDYNDEVAIGVHGIIFHRNFKSFRETRTNFHFEHELKNNVQTSSLGTGTLAFFKKKFNGLSLGHFQSTGMADLWFSSYCKEYDIPMVCVSRDELWLREINDFSDENSYSLWNESLKKEEAQNEFINKYNLWELSTEGEHIYREYLESQFYKVLIGVKNNEFCMKKKHSLEQELIVLKESKSFLLGDLFFRSIKLPKKWITFPINFIKILLNKKPPILKIVDNIVAINHCPICEKKSKFGDFGDPVRLSVQCPVCGSLERHRFLYYIYQILFLGSKRKINLLHMAPEKCLYDALGENKNIHYVAADINPAGYDFAKCIKEDFTKTTFPDKHFDIILTNHILEHIIEEQQYLSEMKRILKDDGYIILSIPYDIKLEKTLEDRSLQTNADRYNAYGQEDHVRVYGSDVNNRLERAGFIVNQICSDIFPEEFIETDKLDKKYSTSRFSGAYFILRKKI